MSPALEYIIGGYIGWMHHVGGVETIVAQLVVKNLGGREIGGVATAAELVDGYKKAAFASVLF